MHLMHSQNSGGHYISAAAFSFQALRETILAGVFMCKQNE